MEAAKTKRDAEIKNNRILKSACGATLVELIVTFSIMVIFLTGITQVISRAITVYHEIREQNYIIQVSDTLMSKIVGEIESAKTSNDCTIHVGDDSVVYSDQTGCPVLMKMEGGYLKLTYGKVMTFEPVDWTYDPKMYKGFTIKSLKFITNVNNNDPRVIRIELVLEGKGISNRAVSYAGFYNIPQNSWDQYVKTGENPGSYFEKFR